MGETQQANIQQEILHRQHQHINLIHNQYFNHKIDDLVKSLPLRPRRQPASIEKKKNEELKSDVQHTNKKVAFKLKKNSVALPNITKHTQQSPMKHEPNLSKAAMQIKSN